MAEVNATLPPAVRDDVAQTSRAGPIDAGHGRDGLGREPFHRFADDQ
jgi:hypothetical protein